MGRSGISVALKCQFWHKDDRLHRADGPAVEWNDGVKSWYYKGVFVGQGDKPDPTLWARLTSVEINGGPLLNGCVVDLKGGKHWFKDDKLHREDGPAVERANGTKWWFFEGERHREDGPAIETSDGTQIWCYKGQLLVHQGEGFWKLWDLLTEEQRANPNLLRWMPR